MDLITLRKYVFSPSVLFSLSGLTLLITAGAINTNLKKPILSLTKQDTAINLDKNLLLYGSAGNKRLLTDLLWIQTLIESDLEHYKRKDLNNWLFLRFNTIATLDPQFYENYLFGGQFLAIVKDDLEGADVIYKKGLEKFPNDYLLNYNAGFLNYFEMGNFEDGLRYLEKIENHPRSPVFIKSIINKLKVATGMELNEVFKLVLHNYENTNDNVLKRKLKGDLYALKAEIDLKCLNNSRRNCDYFDLDNTPYIKKEDQYFAPKTFIQYRIIKKGDTKVPPKEKRIDYIK